MSGEDSTASLEAENEALRAEVVELKEELRMVRGQLKQTVHNYAAGEAKRESMRRELERKLAEPNDAVLVRELERWKELHSDAIAREHALREKLKEIAQIARGA